MLTKSVVVGMLSIMEDRQLQLRTDTVVMDDGAEVSRQYHRVVLAPGDDVSAYDSLVRDVAKLLWTSAVVAAWQEKLQEVRKAAMSRVGNQPPVVN